MLTRMLSMGGTTPGRYKHGDSIIVYDKTFNHSPEKEMDFIVACDKIPPQCGDECYLISAIWIKRWMEYGKGKATLKSVGPIDNEHLVVRDDSDNEYRTRVEISPKIDYRCINKVMWEYLFRGYAGGPVISFSIPIGMSAADLKAKLWLEHVIFTQIPTVVFPSTNKNIPVLQLPPPFDFGFRDDEYDCKHQRQTDNLASAAAVNALQQQIGKAKLQEASKLNDDVQNLSIKSSLMALTNNSKKLEARTKMTSASKILARNDAQHDEEDKAMFIQMQQEGASLFLQLTLKGLYMKKKTMRLKEEQWRLRQEGACLIIQSSWRAKQAIKQKRTLIRNRMEFIAARKLQGSFRCRMARKRTSSLRNTLKMDGAASCIQRAYRSVQGRKRLVEMLNSFHPHTILATMQSATISSNTDAYRYPQERYVVATVFSLNSRARGLTQSRQSIATGLKGAKKKRMSFTTFNPSNQSDNMTMLSFHRSKKATAGKVDAPNHCMWAGPQTRRGSASGTMIDEACMMTNATPSSMLVFSVFEKQTFLGQATVDIKDVASRLYTGETVQLKDLPLHTKSAIPVHDIELGKEIVNIPRDFGNFNTGLLTISLQMPTLTRSMCGWVQRASASFLHGGEFKRRWMMLINEKLLCFEDPYTLNNSKGEMDMTKIYHIGVDKKSNSLVVEIGRDGKTSWTIKWDDGEADHLQAMWERKFKRCLPVGVKFPEMIKKKKKSTL